MYLIFFCLLVSLPLNAYHQFSSQFYSQTTQEILDYVKKFLREDPTILECGAWTGEDTLKLAKTWPLGTIYTFEPIQEHYKELLKKTEQLQNVKVFQLALADRNGELQFHVSDFQNQGHPGGSSSLLAPKEHLKFDQWATFNKVITVPAVTLDQWAAKEGIKQIDFMWLDMQGFELNMLKPSELLKKTKLIYMEVEFVEAYEKQYLYPEIKKWLEDNGFILLAIDFNEQIAIQGDKVIKPGAGLPYYGNALFLNRDMIKQVH